MVEAKCFDEFEIRKELHLENHLKYYKTKKSLGEKIVRSLLFFSKEPTDARKFILKSIERNAISLGENVLKREIVYAHGEKDYDYLFSLIKLKVDIERVHQRTIDIPESIPQIEELAKYRLVLTRLEKTLVYLKESGRENCIRVTKDHSLIIKDLFSLEAEFGRGGYLLRKCKAVAKLIEKGPKESIIYFEAVIRYFENETYLFWETDYLKELSSFIFLNCHLCRFEIARRTLMEVRAFSSSNERYSKQQLKILCKASLHIGLTEGNLETAMDGFSYLQGHENRFDNQELVVPYFTYANVLFVFEKFHDCINIISKIRSLPKDLWEPYSWLVELIRLLCHVELENISIWDSLVLALKRIAKNSDLKYPSFITQILGKLISAPRSEWEEIWNDNIRKYQDLKGNLEESACMDVFDFNSWIDAKINKVPLRDTYFLQPRGHSQVEWKVVD